MSNVLRWKIAIIIVRKAKSIKPWDSAKITSLYAVVLNNDLLFRGVTGFGGDGRVSSAGRVPFASIGINEIVACCPRCSWRYTLYLTNAICAMQYNWIRTVAENTPIRR